MLLLDSNILLIYLREVQLKELIEETYRPFELPNIPIISIVSVGELRALSIKNNWGDKRNAALSLLLEQVVIADINSEDVIQRYAEIDAFSQGRLKSKKLESSARNMGKNDLWIAATASVLNAPLLTLDADFDHLDNEFISVIKIKI